MTDNQIAYANYKENSRHNLVSELNTSAYNESYADSVRAAWYNYIQQANIGKMNAETNARNADTNYYNYLVNEANSAINKQNADTNRLNYQVNLLNANTNQYNAQTNRINADIAAYNAATNRLNYGVNAMNATTNRLNYEVNKQNASTNERNAAVNERNASTNFLNYSVNEYNSMINAQTAAAQQAKMKSDTKLNDIDAKTRHKQNKANIVNTYSSSFGNITRGVDNLSSAFDRVATVGSRVAQNYTSAFRNLFELVK